MSGPVVVERTGPSRPPVLWVVQVVYPAVMSELSKNRMNVVGKRGDGKGQIVKSSSYIRAKANLAQAVTDALVLEKRRMLIPEDELMIREQKLWIAIHLEKRQANIDAVNVVDIVADAIQLASGLNDSYYSLGCVDWSISTVDPMMRLTIWQENES